MVILFIFLFLYFFSYFFFFFFFSSRRRHTRFDCDWSSDVCSSDLDRQRRIHRTPGHRRRSHLHRPPTHRQDRKSTRLNSSHSQISYAVFCLKKKNKPTLTVTIRCYKSARMTSDAQNE